MIEVSNISVLNFDGTFRGMRNPLNSWDKSDSNFGDKIIIGQKDLELAQKLILAGSDHSKFMRQILVSMDITAPLYWWKEMDTYKVGTVANSTSTMHKLASKPITINDFSFDNEEGFIAYNHFYQNSIHTGDEYISRINEQVIEILEQLRKKYINTNNKTYWRALIQLLPESYNQTRTWTGNYAILRNIFFSRQNHKLTEWHTFCSEIKKLPYGKELITIGG